MKMKFFMMQKGDKKSGEDCRYKHGRGLGGNICQIKVINVCAETQESRESRETHLGLRRLPVGFMPPFLSLTEC